LFDVYLNSLTSHFPDKRFVLENCRVWRDVKKAEISHGRAMTVDDTITTRRYHIAEKGQLQTGFKLQMCLILLKITSNNGTFIKNKV